MMRSRSERIASAGLLAALAMIFSYIENLLPLGIGIPGVKLGLANIVIVIALYKMSAGYAFAVNMCRIGVSALLFGNMYSVLYALGGGLLSFAVMALLKRTGRFTIIGVSAAGAVFHNMGQLAVAALAAHTPQVLYYFAVLDIAGIITGVITGVCASSVCAISERRGV